MSTTLYLDSAVASTTDAEGRLTPVTRFRLFSWGVNETSQGPVCLDEKAAEKVMARYEKRNKGRGGWIDIDFFHLSRRVESRVEDRRSAGRCKLELVSGDGGGIDVIEIRPTTEARQMLEADQVRSYSPVVSVHPKTSMLLEIMQLSLTNIPAMDDAGLLAAEDDQAIDEPLPVKTEQVQETKMPESMTLSATPRIEMLLLEAKWSNEMRDMLAKAVGYRFGEHSYLEDWSPEALRVCVYEEGPMPSRHYEIPYTMTGDKIDLGEPVEVVMSYVPKAEAAQAMAMQERATTLLGKVGELTKVDGTTEQIIMLEATFEAAGDSAGLRTRIVELEAERFQRARDASVKAAKDAGTWTKADEEEADEKADMARRLLEDPVSAINRFWSRRTVVVAPGTLTSPLKPVEGVLALSEGEEETAKTVADRLNRPLADVRISLLEQKRARAART